MSEIEESLILFDDAQPILAGDELEESVEIVREDVETIEIDDDSAVTDSVNPAKKKAIKSSNISTTLPLSRIKKICKLDPDVNLVTSDAVKLIAFCTERFIGLLAKSCAAAAKEQGRKTVSNADFQRAIRRSWLFYMLDEAMDEWPENDSKRSKSAASNRSIEDDADANGDEDDAVIAIEDDQAANEEEAIQDDEVIELEEPAEVEKLVSFGEEEEVPMEEGIEDSTVAEEEDEEESSATEESDAENQEEEEFHVKDIEDF